MKLLTHNMLACHVRSHKHEEAQPFLIEVTEQGEADADFDPAFLERMFDRIVWKTLYDGALAMGEASRRQLWACLLPGSRCAWLNVRRTRRSAGNLLCSSGTLINTTCIEL